MISVLRVVGAPGSGKTLLIVSLVEALRSRGHRVATVAPRRDGATLIVVSNGGRVTMQRVLPIAEIAVVVTSIDPSAQIVLAEDYDAPGDAAFPAIALAPHGTAPRADALATVASEEIEATFARHGPGDLGTGDAHGLVDLVEQRVLGLPPRAIAPPPPRGWRAALARLRGR